MVQKRYQYSMCILPLHQRHCFQEKKNDLPKEVNKSELINSNHFRKLYWVDAYKDCLYVSELDGRFRKRLVDRCVDANNTYCFQYPRAIVVHPKYGYDILLVLSFAGSFTLSLKT